MLEFFGFETGAFSQLTRKYMQENFNQKTPDREGIAYYSYGATVDPRFWSMFRQSHRIIQKLEGENDGLVSVQSAKWGTYTEGCQSSGYDQLDKQVALVHVGVDWKQEEVRCWSLLFFECSSDTDALIAVSTPSHSTWTLPVSLPKHIEGDFPDTCILTLSRYVGERRTLMIEQTLGD
jgi:hypothetical protein